MNSKHSRLRAGEPGVPAHVASLGQPDFYVESAGLTDVMFDLPTREDVIEVKVTEASVNNPGTPPLLEISPQRKKKEA